MRVIVSVPFLFLVGLVMSLILSPTGRPHEVYLPFIMNPAPAGKVGLVWPDNANEDAAALLGASWWYDYNVRLDTPPVGGMQFVPFFWCDTWPAHKYTGEVSYYFEIAARHGMDADYSGPLLFLNEPDMPGSDTGGQCDMSPRQAAYLYKALRAEFPNAIYVGPNMSHEDYVGGWPWLKAWYTAVGNLGLPYPDRAGAHSYLDTEPVHILVDSLYANVLDVYPGAPDKVWITEFGSCDPIRAETMINGYEADTRVERYAWFMVSDWQWPACLNLIDSNGDLTPVGETWVNLHGE